MQFVESSALVFACHHLCVLSIILDQFAILCASVIFQLHDRIMGSSLLGTNSWGIISTSMVLGYNYMESESGQKVRR